MKKPGASSAFIFFFFFVRGVGVGLDSGVFVGSAVFFWRNGVARKVYGGVGVFGVGVVCNVILEFMSDGELFVFARTEVVMRERSRAIVV